MNLVSTHKTRSTTPVAVTPTDRPKSVRSRCVIEVLMEFFMLASCFSDFFCECSGFCHKIESDLSFSLSDDSNVSNSCFGYWMLLNSIWSSVDLCCRERCIFICILVPSLSCLCRTQLRNFMTTIIDNIPDDTNAFSYLDNHSNCEW